MHASITLQILLRHNKEGKMNPVTTLATTLGSGGLCRRMPSKKIHHSNTIVEVAKKEGLLIRGSNPGHFGRLFDRNL